MAEVLPNLLSIRIEPPGILIPEGDTEQLTAIGTYSNGDTEDVTASVAWTSDDPTVASIDINGLATGVGPGMTRITATNGVIEGAINVMVEAGLTSIQVAPASPSLTVGSAMQFAATGVFSDSHMEVLTGEVAWSSSDPSIVFVSDTGVATALVPGSASIQASAGSVTGSTVVTAVAAATGPVPGSPADLLAKAQQQMVLLLMGKATVAVETPQLGRVEFNKADMAGLQRLIDYLQVQVDPSAALTMRRRPISLEACP